MTLGASVDLKLSAVWKKEERREREGRGGGRVPNSSSSSTFDSSGSFLLWLPDSVAAPPPPPPAAAAVSGVHVVWRATGDDGVDVVLLTMSFPVRSSNGVSLTLVLSWLRQISRLLRMVVFFFFI